MNNGSKPILPEDPREAEPGRGVPGNNHYGVQTAQTTAVNPPDEEIPSGANAELSREQVEALREQEEGTGLDTTGGYTLDESGRLDNYPVEPEMYIEEN